MVVGFAAALLVIKVISDLANKALEEAGIEKTK